MTNGNIGATKPEAGPASESIRKTAARTPRAIAASSAVVGSGSAREGCASARVIESVLSHAALMLWTRVDLAEVQDVALGGVHLESGTVGVQAVAGHRSKRFSSRGSLRLPL